MTPEVPPILTFSNVSKTYPAKGSQAARVALSNLSLQLTPGMVVGLLGQNGAGKSTLMRCALGILDIDQGEISTLNQTPLMLSAQAKAKIGYVPQQPFGYEGFTVERALELHRSFYPDWDMQLEQDWLVRFDLDATQSVQRLSVGQRQALALIMAMAYCPQLLILDEPVASLDPIARRKFMTDLFDLALESGSAVLFSSHITSDLERVASHVALIKQGRLVLFKEIDALREQVKLLKVSTDAQLPTHLIVLHQTETQATRTIVVDDYLGNEKFPGLISVQSLNLEQLFMELH
ncbi:ABC transporter ATP-binding protein [Shewanella sp. OMA3-2]|uniref:ABC transporter ATP-binding protein n=1 Tax=Shewanella sp. OMA3-2 TaxID=2908650 RepID=UPI001F307B03|nr:ABC transporter ATP-binding protein [Shewanella sp. OMA3-2]UJF22313.1 ABC transporter ATP-binding protein [Shewanella sp. OMA3-2]